MLRFAAQAFRDTFIDGAEGDALTTLVDDHLNLQRQLATASQGAVEFSRTSTGGGEPAGTIPLGTEVATLVDSDGNRVAFTTDADVIVGLGVLGPLSANVTATVAGRAGNVTAGQIQVVTQQPAFDPRWTVTNPLVTGGGNDEERDDALRRRARDFFLTLRRGTLAALEFGAIEDVATVRLASAVEDLLTGIVTLRVSDQDGNSTAQMVNDVVAALINWRAGGSVVNVTGGTQVQVVLGISIRVRTGFSVTASATLLDAAVKNRADKLGPGETLYLDSLIAAIIAVAPDDILDVQFDTITVDGSGAAIGDIEVSDTQVVRVTSTTFAELV